jgi:hypothetical protein
LVGRLGREGGERRARAFRTGCEAGFLSVFLDFLADIEGDSNPPADGAAC